MTAGENQQVYNLAKGHELRLEVAANEGAVVTLLEGTAELFGSELAVGQKIPFTGRKVAFYTWRGCQLRIEGKPEVVYEAEETPLSSYLNAHSVLNARRKQADAQNLQGPRCMVVGPADSGKSTVCLMLVNWAVRTGWTPVFTDLDVGEGELAVPGALSAILVAAPIDPTEGYPEDAPLAYYYGHLQSDEQPELYKQLVTNMAGVFNQRAASSRESSSSGLIINTPGWVDGGGYDLLLHAIATLGVDVVLVMDQDRLYNKLSSHLSAAHPGATIAKLVKSGGVVSRSAVDRKDGRVQRVRAYFYGPHGDLQPQRHTVRTVDLTVFRIGGAPKAPSSLLPMGAATMVNPLRLSPCPVTDELLHCLLAVSYAQSPDAILTSNVAGFVLITDVDAANGLVTYLAPTSSALPGRYLLAGSFRTFLDR